MESALDQKLDLSALHLGTISLGKLLGALLTLVICLIAVRLVTALLRRVLDKTHIDARVRKYLVQSVRLVLWVVTVLITADQLGIPVTSLVALLSVLSLAVSLAVQNVLANVAGGLVLLVTKPFAVGDYVDTPCRTACALPPPTAASPPGRSPTIRLLAPGALSTPSARPMTRRCRRCARHCWMPWPGLRACWTSRRRRCMSMPTAKAASNILSGPGPEPPTIGRHITPCWRGSRRPLTSGPWRCRITT